jgi:4-amino-4-deoxy-L-arabinose transferase-like glycosyltransferase
VNLARDGFTAVAIAALVAAVMYAAALNRRSWALWLLAFALTIVALWIAYIYREPARPGPDGERVVVAPAPRKAAQMIVTYSQEGGQVHYGHRMELR